VVIIAFSAMLLASLGFFTTLGPSLAVAVALMLLAALTLIPALLALTGPRVFWPSKSWQRPPQAPVFGRIGRLVGRRPALVAAASGAIVLALAAGALGFRQNYDFVSQLPSDTESRRAFADLQSGFPAGRSTRPRCTSAATSRWTRPPWPSWGPACSRSRGSGRCNRRSSAPTAGSGRSTCC
jgi:putative drug exporter of the RND superfamily